MMLISKASMQSQSHLPKVYARLWLVFFSENESLGLALITNILGLALITNILGSA